MTKSLRILAQSLDGCLRIRRVADRHKAAKAIVEIRSHRFPGEWTYCVNRINSLPEAWELFNNQSAHHVDPNRFFEPIIARGE